MHAYIHACMYACICTYTHIPANRQRERRRESRGVITGLAFTGHKTRVIVPAVHDLEVSVVPFSEPRRQVARKPVFRQRRMRRTWLMLALALFSVLALALSSVLE